MPTGSTRCRHGTDAGRQKSSSRPGDTTGRSAAPLVVHGESYRPVQQLQQQIKLLFAPLCNAIAIGIPTMRHRSQAIAAATAFFQTVHVGTHAFPTLTHTSFHTVSQPRSHPRRDSSLPGTALVPDVHRVAIPRKRSSLPIPDVAHHSQGWCRRMQWLIVPRGGSSFPEVAPEHAVARVALPRKRSSLPIPDLAHHSQR